MENQLMPMQLIRPLHSSRKQDLLIQLGFSVITRNCKKDTESNVKLPLETSSVELLSGLTLLVIPISWYICKTAEVWNLSYLLLDE